MSDATTPAMIQKDQPRNISVALGAALIGLGLCLFMLNLHQSDIWPASTGAIFAPDTTSLTDMLVYYSYLPRVSVAVLAGILLGLCTTLLQQVLSNPLAEPGTLGIFSASRVAVAVTVLWFPAAANSGFILPSLIGSGIALTVILFLTKTQQFAPLRIVLYGMVLSLCFEAGRLVRSGWPEAVLRTYSNRSGVSAPDLRFPAFLIAKVTKHSLLKAHGVLLKQSRKFNAGCGQIFINGATSDNTNRWIKTEAE